MLRPRSHAALSSTTPTPGRAHGGASPHTRLLRAVVVLGAGALLAGCGSEVASSSAGAPAVAAKKVAPVPAPVVTPVTGMVLYPPVPFEGEDGATHLVYELTLTNFTPATATLRNLVVRDTGSGAAVLTLTGAALGARTKMAAHQQYSADIADSASATVFLHVTLARGTQVPTGLTHELSVNVASPGGSRVDLAETLPPVTVDKRVLPVLSPPLVGSGYIAADGCCDAVRHTRALLPVNGQPLLAQRYAIDYEQLDASGRIYSGPSGDVSSYTIYGKQALAVDNATVVGIMDGLPDQTPQKYPENIGIAEADGNYVVLDLGQGFYANYAHLQAHSLKVQLGDRVRKGQVLGLVGNSGNSVAPHLHFHVMDTASPIASQGLPYLMDEFTVYARAASTAAFDRAEATGEPLELAPPFYPALHRRQMILDQSIATFYP